MILTKFQFNRQSGIKLFVGILIFGIGFLIGAWLNSSDHIERIEIQADGGFVSESSMYFLNNDTLVRWKRLMVEAYITQPGEEIFDVGMVLRGVGFEPYAIRRWKFVVDHEQNGEPCKQGMVDEWQRQIEE